MSWEWEALPFGQIWGIDFEYRQPDGEPPTPICMVAHEWRTDRWVRLWRDQLDDGPPFPLDGGTLFVSYNAVAELQCFVALGWPRPRHFLDLYAEFCAVTSGVDGFGKGFLDALEFYHLPHITKEQKRAGQEMAMRGGPWSAAERRFLLDYCATDVTPLRPLAERMLGPTLSRKYGLEHVLHRGRYMWAVTVMEANGVPLDTGTLDRINTHRDAIKLDLVRRTDKLGVFDGTHFSEERFEGVLHARGVDWPRHPSGRVMLDHDRVFKPMADAYPWLQPIRELRSFLSQTKLGALHVGSDGRNRTSLMPFRSKTGRNQPSNNSFVFGPGKWIRHLIKPPEGRSVAYIDWSRQEFCIAAVLARDPRMLLELEAGDVYLAFAHLAGWAPMGATKQTHGQARDRAKPCLLGWLYGMGQRTLAQRMGTDTYTARETMRALASTYDVFTKWAEDQINQGVMRGELRTVFGWPMHVIRQDRPNTLRNFLVQANGAEMMRLAACMATEQGVCVAAPVHDAFLIEADTGDIEDAVATMRRIMVDASRVVLDGYEIDTDAEITHWPNHCVDGRGSQLWTKLVSLLPAESLHQ